MAYLPQPHPRENQGKKNTLGKEQPLSIIEVIRSPATSGEIISIRKARNPKITIRSIIKERFQHKKTFDKKHSECYKCGKKFHFRSECKSKAKALINILQGDQTNKDEIFKLLEHNHTDSELSSSSSDHEIFQMTQSSSSRESSSISSSPDIRQLLSVNVHSQQEELLLTLIEKVEDPVVKGQHLSQFQKNLVRETKETKSKHSEPLVNLEKIFNRFTKAKKEITVNYLQHEIKETKSDIRTLR